MIKILTASDLLSIMHFWYPDEEEDEQENHEHPMTAVGVVLLSAAIIVHFWYPDEEEDEQENHEHPKTKVKELVRFTGYSRRFISAIAVNMQNNKVWFDGRYDCSGWLSSDGMVDKERFWEHIDLACGSLWLPGCDSSISADSCMIYWNEKENSPGDVLLRCAGKAIQ